MDRGPQQTEQRGNIPFPADVDGFLHVCCALTVRGPPEQGGIFSFQADVGVDSETTTA